VNWREQAQENVSEVFSKCSDDLSSYRPIKAAAFFNKGMNLKSIYLRRSLGKQYKLKKADRHSCFYAHM
jgi:hypothetical protein